MAEPENQRRGDSADQKLYTLSEISRRPAFRCRPSSDTRRRTRTASRRKGRGASSVTPRARCRCSTRSRTKTPASAAVRARIRMLPRRSVRRRASAVAVRRAAPPSAPPAAARPPLQRRATAATAARAPPPSGPVGEAARPPPLPHRRAARAVGVPGVPIRSPRQVRKSEIRQSADAHPDQRDHRHLLSHAGPLRARAQRSSAERGQGACAPLLSAGGGRVPPAPSGERPRRPQEGERAAPKKPARAAAAGALAASSSRRRARRSAARSRSASSRLEKTQQSLEKKLKGFVDSVTKLFR